MGHILEVTDEQYETMRKAAAARGETPEQLLAEVITAWHEEQHDPMTEPRYYETEEWFRHLGASEEVIAESQRLFEQRAAQQEIEQHADA